MYSELYFWIVFEDCGNCCFLKKNILIISYSFIYPKTSNFHNSRNLHNSGMVGRRKLPDASMNNVFNVLSINLQYTLSLKWPDFGLKRRVTLRLVYSMKFSHFLKQAGIVIHFLNLLIVTEILLWNRKKKTEVDRQLIRQIVR